MTKEVAEFLVRYNNTETELRERAVYLAHDLLNERSIHSGTKATWAISQKLYATCQQYSDPVLFWRTSTHGNFRIGPEFHTWDIRVTRDFVEKLGQDDGGYLGDDKEDKNWRRTLREKAQEFWNLWLEACELARKIGNQLREDRDQSGLSREDLPTGCYEFDGQICFQNGLSGYIAKDHFPISGEHRRGDMRLAVEFLRSYLAWAVVNNKP